jgi:microcystin-dependent protein
MFAGSFAPAGWAWCNGAQLPISENETLFQLIGTTYGGDGQETFNLPDLASRAPMHKGNQYVLAEMGGVESVTLTVQQLPTHTHPFTAMQPVGNQVNPAGNLNGETTGYQMYIQDSPSVPMSNLSVTPVGGSQPHENLQPYLAISFIISLFGLFPNPT